MPIEDGEIKPLSPTECWNTTTIIDTGPRNLERVTPENCLRVIESGAQVIESRRRSRELVRPNASMMEALALKVSRHDRAHAIQCAINPTVDAQAYIGVLEKHNVPPNNPDAQRIKDFFQNNSALYAVLEKLYRIDIILRISQEKKDATFAAVIQSQFDALKSQLGSALESFKRRDGNLLANMPKERRAEIENAVTALETSIAKGLPENFQATFYDDICQGMAAIAEADYDVQIDALKNCAERLLPLEMDAVDGAALKAAHLSRIPANEKALAEFLFDYGFTSDLDPDNDLDGTTDRAKTLFQFKASSAREFLDRSEEFAAHPDFEELAQKASNALKK